MVRANNDDIKTMKQRKNLLIAKSLFFSTSMSNVGWSRFQNNFYLDQGLSSTEIGKSLSLANIITTITTIITTIPSLLPSTTTATTTITKTTTIIIITTVTNINHKDL